MQNTKLVTACDLNAEFKVIEVRFLEVALETALRQIDVQARSLGLPGSWLEDALMKRNAR